MRGDVVYVKDATVTEAVGDVPAGFKEVAVVTGITDGDYVEIISGLTGDEELYVERISEAVTTANGMGGFGVGGMTGERPSDASGMPSGGGGGMPGQ
jgi:HlyD family secretion protein